MPHNKKGRILHRTERAAEAAVRPVKKRRIFMEKLMEILKGIRPEVDFEKEEALIDDAVLDSFDLVSLISI